MIKVTDLEPLKGRLLAEKIESNTERDDIDFALPFGSSGEDGFKEAIVIAVGKEDLDEKGEKIPSEVKVGDHIIFQWADSLRIDGKEIFSMKELNVISIVNKK